MMLCFLDLQVYKFTKIYCFFFFVQFIKLLLTKQELIFTLLIQAHQAFIDMIAVHLPLL